MALVGTDLIFAPVAASPVDTFAHTITASLQKFPTVTQDIPFSVKIVDCAVNGFFVTNAAASRTDIVEMLTLVLGVDPNLTLGFSFADFDVTGTAGCEGELLQEYEIKVDGVVMDPSWLTISGNTITILSGD